MLYYQVMTLGSLTYEFTAQNDTNVGSSPQNRPSVLYMLWTGQAQKCKILSIHVTSVCVLALTLTEVLINHSGCI